MTEKYKILGRYIKDTSGETPDIETYIFVRDRINKYQLSIDLLKAIWYISDILEKDYGVDAMADIKDKIQFIEEDNIRSSNDT